ncbi:hypothetical protein PPERSA_13037 [Pseudocohnilembus persalinus]|uniref:PCI domain-containing protein n=1 Tax=Pseudocohnilembus persalinus TaxID=266149 RepID=A0A0V0R222_PSEPJ|nr:hypothetical protein PPERSA_13037 [Pseudocohnilembus persalinus]|eukprot:KRX08556.1 hypothetical protein PPERSA_13037 [Pseudocohnilembus persalinus]
MSEGQILNELQQQYPHLDKTVEKMKLYYTEKLWHQLTLCILDLIRDEKVLQNHELLSNMYTNFIINFENKMDPIKLTKFICVISEFKGTDDQKVEFMDSIIDKSVKDPQAVYILKLKKSEFLLKQQKYEEVDKQFKEIVVSLGKQANIDTHVHSALYRLGYLYHKQKQNFDQLYKYGLQYLAYTSENDITHSQKFNLSMEMALAIMISTQIYNYSELLQQPVLKSIKDSQSTSWIYELLDIFNKGDVEASNKALQQYSSQINSNELLQKNANVLQEKIKILAFIDLVFNQPKNQRNINFQTIANVCKISLNEVEYLLMRAMAKGLVRGRIDQVKYLNFFKFIQKYFNKIYKLIQYILGQKLSFH